MGLRGVIGSLATGTYTVTRQPEGVTVRGRYLLSVAIEAVDASTDTLELVAHGLPTGTGPFQLTTTGTLPGGLTAGTDYWVITADADALQLATSAADADDEIAVELSSAGTGTLSLVKPASTFSIIASVQPVAGRELQMLPEGEHGDEALLVITETELRTRRSGNDPDRISIDGELWRVVHVETWRSFGAVHYETFVRRGIGGP